MIMMVIMSLSVSKCSSLAPNWVAAKKTVCMAALYQKTIAKHIFALMPLFYAANGQVTKRNLGKAPPPNGHQYKRYTGGHVVLLKGGMKAKGRWKEYHDKTHYL